MFFAAPPKQTRRKRHTLSTQKKVVSSSCLQLVTKYHESMGFNAYTWKRIQVHETQHQNDVYEKPDESETVAWISLSTQWTYIHKRRTMHMGIWIWTVSANGMHIKLKRRKKNTTTELHFDDWESGLNAVWQRKKECGGQHICARTPAKHNDRLHAIWYEPMLIDDVSADASVLVALCLLIYHQVANIIRPSMIYTHPQSKSVSFNVIHTMETIQSNILNFVILAQWKMLK